MIAFNLLVLFGFVGSQFFLIKNVASSDELWVACWSTLLAISSFWFPCNRKVDTKFFAPLLLIVFLSVFLNVKSQIFTIFMHVFVRVFFGCLSIKVIAERITLSAKQIGNLLLVLWMFVYLVLISQHLGLTWRGYELSGFYTMPWMMGCAAVLSIPFIKKLKSWYGIILLFPILVSHSTAIVAVALVLWIQPKLSWKSFLKYLLLIVLLVLCYVFLFDRGLDHARFAVIKNSISFVHNWVTGDGIGSWAHRGFIMYNGKDPYYWRWAHNELFQMTTETGLLGGFCVLALISNLFKRISFEQRYYLFGILALSMVHPIFHIPRLIPFLILIFAFMIRRNSVEDKTA